LSLSKCAPPVIALIFFFSYDDCIAIARQIFQNKVFFSLPGEVFLIKKKKKVFMKNLPGASNIIKAIFHGFNLINDDMVIRYDNHDFNFGGWIK
jgi:hypothetical protein